MRLDSAGSRSSPKGARYSVIALIDDSVPLNTFSPDDEQSQFNDDMESIWRRFQIAPAPSADSVAVCQFLAMAALSFRHWELQWRDALDAIRSTTQVDLENTLDDEKWKSLMFDNSSERSSLYFTVLELLRISSNWIEDTLRDWKGLEENWSSYTNARETLSAEDVDICIANWKNVTITLEKRTDGLLHSIARQMEEVKSLRDGV